MLPMGSWPGGSVADQAGGVDRLLLVSMAVFGAAVVAGLETCLIPFLGRAAA